jgi:hypothetical protein
MRPAAAAVLVVFVAFAQLGAACSRSTESTPQGAAPTAEPRVASPVTASEPAEGSAPAPAPARPPGPQPMRATVTLVEPGKPPRKRLRYSFRVQPKPQNEALRLELRTSLSQAVGDAGVPDITLPPVTIVIAIEPQSVTAEGDLLTYAWHVVRATSSPGSSPAQIAEGMRAEVAAVGHLSGTGVVDWQGISRGVSTDPPDADASDPGSRSVGADGTGQMVEQIRQTLRDMAAPFPMEDVGAGARWTKASELVSKEAVLTQTDAFTLTSLQGGTGTLDDVLAQTAPAQVLRGPGLPDGAEARMESMLASGQAKTRFDLSRLVPQTKFDGSTTMVLSSAAPREEARRMTMSLRIGMTVSGTLD